MHDEAELRGHRRTYIGAMAGRLMQAMRRAGANNPVIMLDEVDKLGRDFRGDPASALLEVLDPEQNKTFRDNYLDVEFDLSKAMFITTANSLETIPRPLLDRMELLRLAGYSEEEKVEIAHRYLIPRQLIECGLDPLIIEIKDDALHGIIANYTREAGLRQLERGIRKVARKIALALCRRPQRAGFGRGGRSVRFAGPREEFAGEDAPAPSARRGGRARLDRDGRGSALCGSRAIARRQGPHHDRPIGRRDAGIGQGGAEFPLVARRGVRHRPRAVPYARAAHPRARRFDPQGRTIGRRGHGQRPSPARILALRPVPILP